jgi:hypothetical protein
LSYVLYYSDSARTLYVTVAVTVVEVGWVAVEVAGMIAVVAVGKIFAEMAVETVAVEGADAEQDIICNCCYVLVLPLVLHRKLYENNIPCW